MLRKRVATQRLNELRHLRAIQKLAAWRRSNGFDRCDVHDGKWIHSPQPRTLEETTASMWADLNALKKEISMSEKERSKQRVEGFLNELEQETASLTKRIGRAAAHVVVARVDTAQPCNPRSSCSQISFHVHVCMEGNTQKRMDPGPGQLESSSAGTGIETPGQQFLPNWEMGRTTVDGCLLVGVSSNLRETFFPCKNSASGCKPIAKLQHILPYQNRL